MWKVFCSVIFCTISFVHYVLEVFLTEPFLLYICEAPPMNLGQYNRYV